MDRGDKMNKIALDANGGFMPVYRPRHKIMGKGHFAFFYPEQVKHFNYCDIYEKPIIRNKKIVGYRYESKGDRLISEGFDIQLKGIGYLMIATILFTVGLLI